LLCSLCRTVAQTGMFLTHDELDIHLIHIGLLIL
jgi:hypothetical protein